MWLSGTSACWDRDAIPLCLVTYKSLDLHSNLFNLLGWPMIHPSSNKDCTKKNSPFRLQWAQNIQVSWLTIKAELRSGRLDRSADHESKVQVGWLSQMITKAEISSETMHSRELYPKSHRLGNWPLKQSWGKTHQIGWPTNYQTELRLDWSDRTVWMGRVAILSSLLILKYSN